MEKKITLKLTLIVAFIIFVVDRVTKLFFVSNDSHTLNDGFSLGLFDNTNIIAIIVVLLMLCLIAILILKIKDSYQIRNLLIIIFVAGCSNLLDRFLYGGVVDFIDIPLVPTFNIADLTISVSIFLLIFVFITDGREKSTKSK